MPDFRPAKVHLDLGDGFFDDAQAAAFPQHIMRYRNQKAAASVGLDGLSDDEWIAHFGRFESFDGSFKTPLALRYHGHQFDVYNPQLGDGRGFLFAQAYDEKGRLLDLGTKGTGRTRWARDGDGRLTLKGGVREVLATSMLEALGVDTSKSFSLIETGENLVRGDEPSPTRSSVLVRLNHSHIRIGTFQRLAFESDIPALRRLVNHCVGHYLPEARRENEAEQAAAFLENVCARVATTGARWIAAGFVHGVLNSDNINVTGESFDYGPWRFVPVYDPGFTAAYFDHNGLYAFGQQPDALAKNLTRLAQSLLPIGEQSTLEAALNTFWQVFRDQLARAFMCRLGFDENAPEVGTALVSALIAFLAESGAPYEQVLFDLYAYQPERLARGPLADLYASELFVPLKTILSNVPIHPRANPGHAYFLRTQPRTMLIDQVEAIWAPIAAADDWSEFDRTLAEIGEMADAYRSVTKP